MGSSLATLMARLKQHYNRLGKSAGGDTLCSGACYRRGVQGATMAGNRAVIIGAGAVIVIGLLWVVYRGAPDMHPAAPGVSASKPSTPSSQPVRPSNPPSAPQTETNATTAPTASPALPAAPAIKASFDCSKAVINAEKIICADASLAAMDVELDSLFKRARARTTDPSTLDSDQGAWLENRNACASRSCLRSAYAEREEDVRRWLAQ